MDCSVANAQDVADPSDEDRRKRSSTVQGGQKLLVVVDVISDGEQGGCRAGLRRQMICKPGKKSRCRPRKRLKSSGFKVLPIHTNEIGPFLLGRGAQHRRARLQPSANACPVHFVHPGAVTSDGNHPVVALGKGVYKCVCEPRSEIVSSLLVSIHLENGKWTAVNGPPGVPVQRPSDPLVLVVVLPHEALVLPLPLRAVAEEQDGGIVNGGTDGDVTGYSSIETDGSNTTCRGHPLQT